MARQVYTHPEVFKQLSTRALKDECYLKQYSVISHKTSQASAFLAATGNLFWKTLHTESPVDSGPCALRAACIPNMGNMTCRGSQRCGSIGRR